MNVLVIFFERICCKIKLRPSWVSLTCIATAAFVSLVAQDLLADSIRLQVYGGERGHVVSTDILRGDGMRLVLESNASGNFSDNTSSENWQVYFFKIPNLLRSEETAQLITSSKIVPSLDVEANLNSKPLSSQKKWREIAQYRMPKEKALGFFPKDEEYSLLAILTSGSPIDDPLELLLDSTSKVARERLLIRTAPISILLRKAVLHLKANPAYAIGQELEFEAYLDLPRYAWNYTKEVAFKMHSSRSNSSGSDSSASARTARKTKILAQESLPRISTTSEIPTKVRLSPNSEMHAGVYLLEGQAWLRFLDQEMQPENKSLLVEFSSKKDPAAIEILDFGLYQDEQSQARVVELSSGEEVFVSLKSKVPQSVKQFSIEIKASLSGGQSVAQEVFHGTGSSLAISFQLPVVVPEEGRGENLTLTATILSEDPKLNDYALRKVLSIAVR